MRATTKMAPDEFIVSALSPMERLDAAMLVVREAFRRSSLKPADIERTVQRLRLKARRTDRQK